MGCDGVRGYDGELRMGGVCGDGSGCQGDAL